MTVPGFYWLDEGNLAGSALPELSDPWFQMPDTPALRERTLNENLRWLVDQGIGAILTLTEEPLAAVSLQRYSLASLHLPIPDQTAPRTDDFLAALDFIDAQHSLDRAVLVHCHVGMGRTGSILAAWLIRQGATPEQAIARLRAIRPGSVSTLSQEEALARFAARREWIV